jgi:hypothetical protein
MSKDTSIPKKTTTSSSGEEKTENAPTKEQLELRDFLKLLAELQTKGKINGQQFRENRELWMRQQPNDRDVLTWRLKKLLTTENIPNLDKPKSQPFQKPRKM